MAHILISSESGDWFLVPEEKRNDFLDDEYEGRDVSYATYVEAPRRVRILQYEVNG